MGGAMGGGVGNAMGGGGGGAVSGRCFVTGVPADFTATDFQMYFQQYGDLTDVFVPSGGKGIAYVSFADPQVAQSVIEQREHEVKPGQTVRVEQAFDRQGGTSEKGGKGKGIVARPSAAMAFGGVGGFGGA